jgi:uncharacterized membrane protein YhaH (DUF805 family)
MSSPATDQTGSKPAASPAHPNARAAGAAGVFGLLFLLGSIFLWPIFFVIDLVLGLVRSRGLLFPIGFRARRKHFWNVLGIYLLLGFVVLVIYAAADEQDISRTTASVFAGVMGAAIAASLLAVAVSRLHDRDLSGWWAFFYIGIPAAAIAALARGNAADWEFGVFGLLITVFVPWAIFALGFRAGAVGPNRFGEESPWFRDTRRRRVPAPPPIPQGNPEAATPAPAAATQAPAMAMQAPVAPVVSSTAGAQAAQPPAPAALVDHRGRIRRAIGDLISATLSR